MDVDPPGKESLHQQAMRLGRRIGIAIAGGLVITAGVALLVLPGPGIVVIAVGVGILSLEFERPRVWIAQAKVAARTLQQRWKRWRASRNPDSRQD